eukprot:1520955-Rhodomonas_salina.3
MRDETVPDAALSSASASAEAERAQELARETTVEIHVAERRIAQTAPVFAELEALREIVDHVELARAVLFPPQ